MLCICLDDMKLCLLGPCPVCVFRRTCADKPVKPVVTYELKGLNEDVGPYDLRKNVKVRHG